MSDEEITLSPEKRISMQNLYRHFDADGKLLYVGVSLSAIRRLNDHKESHWFDDIARVHIEKFPDRQSVLEAERLAIHKENPLYNLKRPTPEEVKNRNIKQAENSRTDLVNRLVQFNLMYTVQQAAEQICISVSLVKRLMDEGKIGYIKIGERNTKFGMRPVFRISGWQLIDFIEQLQEGKVKIHFGDGE